MKSTRDYFELKYSIVRPRYFDRYLAILTAFFAVDLSNTLLWITRMQSSLIGSLSNRHLTASGVPCRNIKRTKFDSIPLQVGHEGRPHRKHWLRRYRSPDAMSFSAWHKIHSSALPAADRLGNPSQIEGSNLRGLYCVQ